MLEIKKPLLPDNYIIKKSPEIEKMKWLNGKKEIEFNYDSLGYRNNKNFEECISHKNFAIAFGCSHTFGYAIDEHDRYSSIVAQQTSIPVYNAGVNGAANNFIVENTMELIKKDIIPTFVIVQWASPYRYTFYTDTQMLKVIPEMKEYSKFYELLSQKTDYTAWYKHNFLHCYNLIQYLWQSKGVKVINVKGSGAINDLEVSDVADMIYWETIDLAPDLSHSGPLSNRKLANKIIQYV